MFSLVAAEIFVLPAEYVQENETSHMYHKCSVDYIGKPGLLRG